MCAVTPMNEGDFMRMNALCTTLASIVKKPHIKIAVIRRRCAGRSLVFRRIYPGARMSHRSPMMSAVQCARPD